MSTENEEGSPMEMGTAFYGRTRRVLLPRALAVTVTHNCTEAPLILRRSDERADHAAMVTGTVQHVEPEVLTLCL